MRREKRLLSLADFDGKTLDGLSFCRGAYRLFDQIRAMPDGPSRLRMLRTKTEKRLTEELLLIARYVQVKYHEAYRLKVRWESGSQQYDAVLFGSGIWVEKGISPKRLVLETTIATHKNEYLVRENVDRGGASFGPELTRRDANTGSIVSEPHVRREGAIQSDLAAQIIDRIRAKSAKNYAPNTVLIVGCVPNTIVLYPEWTDSIREVVRAQLTHGFSEIFVMDRRFSFFTTLPNN